MLLKTLRQAIRATLLHFISILLACSVVQAAQSPDTAAFPRITVSDLGASVQVIGSRMGVLVDPTRRISLDDVTAADAAWSAISRPTPNFGFSHDAHWFRFELFNSADVPLERLLELPVPFIDDVQLYQRIAGTTVMQYSLGDEKPFAQRTVQHHNFVMPLTLQPGPNAVYVRMASAGTIEAGFRLWERNAFLAESNHDNLVQGAVAGVLLVMIAYNLFIFFSTGDRNYLLYIGFVASYLLFYFTLTGYSYQYLWPQSVRWNSFAISSFIATSLTFTCWFANSFLRLAEFSPNIHRLLRALGWACLALFAGTFFLPYSWTIRIGTALTMPVAATALVMGYWRWLRGAKFARFYCLAWTAVLLGLVILNANKLGLIAANVWTNNASQIGVMLQVVLLSFTLADRINHDRSLRIKAQEAALQHEREARASSQALMLATEAANRDLETRVQSRTAELNETMEQLQHANTQLQRLSTTDALTQVRNRAFFDSAWPTEVRRASRTLSPVTLVLFDIDHFKRVNDTHGHPAGDACLRTVAATIAAHVGRAGDVLARYGGEEFAVILMDTGLEQALTLIETFRASVEAQAIAFEDQTIHLTASFGLAHGVPSPHTSADSILALADKALYRAKHDGRNCVRHETL